LAGAGDVIRSKIKEPRGAVLGPLFVAFATGSFHAGNRLLLKHVNVRHNIFFIF